MLFYSVFLVHFVNTGQKKLYPPTMKTVILALLKLFTGLKRHPKFSAKNEHILYVLDVLGFTFVFFFFFAAVLTGPQFFVKLHISYL